MGAESTDCPVELEPEPEGGEELTAIKTMPGSRMKNMGEVQGVTNDEGTVYDFWMTASVEGAIIKEINTKVLKDASKKANFPGFRKVKQHMAKFDLGCDSVEKRGLPTES